MIFITSYTYFGSRHINIFRHFKKKDDLVFILPEKWLEKDGRIIPLEISREEFKVISTPAYFYHSRYPIIRGMLKGWMPATGRILRSMAKPGDILYTAIEPNLLVTYFNARLARKLKMKHVFAVVQNISHRQRLSGLKLKITERIIRSNVGLAAGAVCALKRARDVLKPYTPKDFPLAIIPVSGANTEHFMPGISSDFRKKYRLEGKIILVFAGVFEKRKGLATLLEAFKHTVGIRPEIHLVMIGRGIMRVEIDKYILQNNLKDSITIIEWLPNQELPGVYAQSDIFIYPSEPHKGWEEQLGYSILEASASGLPIIATQMGSMDEIVLDGKSGILVPPADSSALSGAILRLASDSELRKTMGQAARQHMLDNFSHKSIAQRLEKFLRSL